MRIRVYSDASTPAGKKPAVAYMVMDDHFLLSASCSLVELDKDNNTRDAELVGVCRALESITSWDEVTSLEIYTDSQTAIKVLGRYINKGNKSNLKTKELKEKLHSVLKRIPPSCKTSIQYHDGHTLERTPIKVCDTSARYAALCLSGA